MAALVYIADTRFVFVSLSNIFSLLYNLTMNRLTNEARSIGLSVNESKTKLLLSTAKDTSIGVSVEIDDYNFEVVKYVVYLAPA